MKVVLETRSDGGLRAADPELRNVFRSIAQKLDQEIPLSERFFYIVDSLSSTQQMQVYAAMKAKLKCPILGWLDASGRTRADVVSLMREFAGEKK